MENVITVTKTAEKKVAANYAHISVTVYGEAKKYSAAIDAAEVNCNAFTRAFSAVDGVVLSRGAMNVTSVRDEKKIVGYRAAQCFSAEFNLDNAILKKAMDALGELAVEWNISFSFKDSGERAELIKLAVQGAKSDAGVIAAAAGVKIGELAHVEYSSASMARPMLMRAAKCGGDVAPEQITLDETVVCSWKIV